MHKEGSFYDPAHTHAHTDIRACLPVNPTLPAQENESNTVTTDCARSRSLVHFREVPVQEKKKKKKKFFVQLVPAVSIPSFSSA